MNDLDGDPWAHWGPAGEEPHHRQARERTDDEAEAIAARTRRHFGLPDGVDHTAELYPDDPQRAQQHRSAIERLKGSLARQIEHGREGR